MELLAEHARNKTKNLTKEAKEMLNDHSDSHCNNNIHSNHIYISQFRLIVTLVKLSLLFLTSSF